MRAHRSLFVTGILLAAVGVSRAEFFQYDSTMPERTFSAPVSGVYDITASGGQGGSVSTITGGLGGSVEGKFFLAQGEELSIWIGSAGADGIGGAGGGGGATFVMDASNNPLLIAGGGGGAGTSAGGNPAGGIAASGGGGGGGGSAAFQKGGGGGGGGLKIDGTDGAGDSEFGESFPGGAGGKSFIDGLAGGAGGVGEDMGANGGFGGGGGGADNGGGGGGGGYTGGDGGNPFAGGNGGSSFDADPLGTFSATSFDNGSVNILIPQASAVPAPASVEAGAVLLVAMGLIKCRRRSSV